MDDQVMQLKSQGERRVVCIHSGMDEQEKKYQCIKSKSFYISKS